MSADYYNYKGEPIDDSEITDLVDEFLEEVDGEVRIGELTYNPGRVLRNLDPIAWREVMLDWVDQRSPARYVGGGYSKEDLIFEDPEEAAEFRNEFLDEDGEER